jgi:hypothetical protein
VAASRIPLSQDLGSLDGFDVLSNSQLFLLSADARYVRTVAAAMKGWVGVGPAFGLHYYETGNASGDEYTTQNAWGWNACAGLERPIGTVSIYGVAEHFSVGEFSLNAISVGVRFGR